MAAGRLFLLPAGLSEDTPAEAVVPAAVIERIRSLDARGWRNALIRGRCARSRSWS
jgi:hypothetical protein